MEFFLSGSPALVGAHYQSALANPPLLIPLQLNSPMNPVSSSEDIKPPLGLNGVLKVPAHPSGNMASFTKHICAICGDRSSGRTAWWVSLAFSTGLDAGRQEARVTSCVL